MWAADEEFAGLVGCGDVCAVRVDEFDFHVKEGEADRTGFALNVLRGQPEGVGAGFGQAVAGFEVNVFGPEFIEDGAGTGGAAADDEFEAGKVGGGPAGVLLEHDEHGGYAEKEGDRMALDEVKDLFGVEVAAEDGGGTDVHQRGGEDVEPAGMEERGVEDGHVGRGEVPTGGGVDGVPEDVAVGQDGAFGQAGGAAGVADEPGVVVGEGGSVEISGGVCGAFAKVPVVRVGGLVERDPVGDGRAVAVKRLNGVGEFGAVEQETGFGVGDEGL